MKPLEKNYCSAILLDVVAIRFITEIEYYISPFHPC